MAIVVAGGSSLLSRGASLLTTSPSPSPATSRQFLGPESFPDVQAPYYAIVNHANTRVWHVGGGEHRIEKSGGSASTYDASAVSSAGFTGDFVLRLSSPDNAGGFAGVSATPTADDASIIDFSWQLFSGGYRPFVGGAQTGFLSVPTYAWIWRTGTAVGFGRGDDLAAAQASPDYSTTSSATLYFDSSLIEFGNVIGATFFFPDLTGQTLTATQGSVTAAVSIALTGQSLSAAQGSVLQGAPLVGQTVTAAQGSSTAGIAIALTGQSVTAARGSVTQASSAALTSQSIAVGQGSIIAALSFALSGQGVSVARGSVLAAPSAGISGQSAAAAQGTITPTATAAISGQSVAAAQGSLTPALTATLAGQSLTAGQGPLVPGSALTLVGASIVANRGALTAGSGIELTGVSALIAQGSITAETLTTYLFWQPGPLIGRRTSVSRSR